MPFVTDALTLDLPITSLELVVTTIDAGDADSGDDLFVNVVFSDGTRLYEPENHFLGGLPPRGEGKRYALPFPDEIDRKLGDVAELLIRKNGDDGWLVGSVLLFANELAEPLIGSAHANQFLDNDDAVLQLREWSTRSICVAQATHPRHPLLPSGYRVLGPVIGQVTSDSAVVLYHVDREGTYRFRAVDTVSGALVADITAELAPNGRFELAGLTPNREFAFDLELEHAGVFTPVPDAAGRLRTYPLENARGRLSFAFGSCANPREAVAQGAWAGIRALAQSSSRDIGPLQLFVHLGDTFYFYDFMTEEVPRNVESMHAAHISARRHPEFLDMARVVPCVGVWDDHDFASNNTYRPALEEPGLLKPAIDTWLEYWGNRPMVPGGGLGLTTRITHGLVDIYLLDGRSFRDLTLGTYFGKELIHALITSIDERGRKGPRVVVLATGSNWNHESTSEENYNNGAYATERKALYAALAARMGTTISGLLLLSGDDHVNEVYHVNVADGAMAPEFVSSPLTHNDEERSNDLVGERVASFSSADTNGRRGFAVLTIDTSHPVPEGNWTATVSYFREVARVRYATLTYVLKNGQFRPT